MDEDDKSFFEEGAIRRLEVLIKCSRCQRTPRKNPIFQCHLGHLFCNECDGCLNCEYREQNIRSLLAEQILRHIPTVCENEGCEVVLVRGDMTKHMEEECMHRALPCVLPTCDALVSIKNLFRHIDRDHIKSDTFIANASFLNHYLHVDQCFFERESWWKPTVLELVDEDGKKIHFFFQCHRTESGIWRLWVYTIGSRKESILFQYQIILSRGTEELMFRDRTVYIGLSIKEISESGFGLCISDEAAKRFLDTNENKIQFQVVVSKKTDMV